MFLLTLRADKLRALSAFFGMRGLCDGGGLVSLGKTDNKASRFVPNHVLEHAMMKDRWQWPQFLSPPQRN